MLLKSLYVKNLNPLMPRPAHHLCPLGCERNKHHRTQRIAVRPVERLNQGILKKPISNSLPALTAAAFILPGLIQPVARAADNDSVDFQYSHYQEGRRDIYGTEDYDGNGINETFKIRSNIKPIEVDGLRGSTRITLTDRVKFAFNYTQDTWSGATPVATVPVASALANRPIRNQNGIVVGASPQVPEIAAIFIDGKGDIFGVNTDNTTGGIIPGPKDNRLNHVLAGASPETRKQGDFKLSYEWDEAAAEVGGGISIENDYESRFVNLGGRMDFNQKQTTVNLGLSYTNSDTFAAIDPDGLQFISTDSYGHREDLIIDNKSVPIFINIPGSPGYIDTTYDERNKLTGAVVRGNRQDWDTQLGLTQILNKDAVLELGMGYTRSTGFMANPYKLVQVFALTGTSEEVNGAGIKLYKSSGAFIEKRPDERNQFNWNLGYNQYIEPLDAAVHLDYRFAHDDWGINAHTFEADWVQPLGSGWTVTPRVRYYSQSSADFLRTFFKASNASRS